MIQKSNVMKVEKKLELDLHVHNITRRRGHVRNLFGHLVRKWGSQFSTLFILVDVSNHLLN